MKRLCALLFFFPAGAACLHSQVSSSISGAISDPSRARIPAAEVQVKDIETGATRHSTTDAAGRYQVLALPVGEYQLRVSKAGFQEQIRDGIHLSVGEEARVDVILQVGAVKQHVTVLEDAPLVSLSSRDLSGLVGERQVKELPLNGRSYDLLLPLNPGIVNFTSQK